MDVNKLVKPTTLVDIHMQYVKPLMTGPRRSILRAMTKFLRLQYHGHIVGGFLYLGPPLQDGGNLPQQ